MEVVLEGVSRRFVLKNRAVVALRDVSLRFPSGGVSIVFGPSGSGKSVMLNLIAGLDRPDEGSISIGGNVITAMSWPELNMFRRRHISYCMQRNVLIPRLKVGLNIALPLLIRGVDRGEALEKARDLAEALGIGYTFDRAAYTLSGGEQRRAVLARSLTYRADLLLLDEPTSNLDEETAERVRDVIMDYYREYGPTLIVATHDPGFMDMGDYRVRLVEGRVVEQG